MPSENSQGCCIVIPVYRTIFTPVEKAAFRNFCQIFSSLPIRIVCPSGLTTADGFDNEINGLLSKTPDIQVIPLDPSHFSSVDQYNLLMLDSSFYAHFTVWDYILLAQLDSWVFESNLEAWAALNYSYIGAPWKSLAGLPLGPSWPLEAVGNGGLSLRKVDHFRRVLSSWRFWLWPVLSVSELVKAHRPLAPFSSGFGFGALLKACNRFRIIAFRAAGWRNTLAHFSQSGLHEDIIYGLLVPRVFSFWSVPLPSVAARFALDEDVNYFYHRYLDPTLPFGCHAWEKAYLEFWCSLNTNLPGSLILSSDSER